MSEITLQDALKKQNLNFFKKSIDSKIIDKFAENFEAYAMQINRAVQDKQREDYFKKILNDFLRDNFYYENKYSINIKGDIDSAIYKDGILRCMIEAKAPKNTSEMITKDNLNKKAFHELIYYYLTETRDLSGNKVKNNLNTQIQTLVATNCVDYFIFSASDIENIVRGEIEKYYFEFKNNAYNVSSSSYFYTYLFQFFNEHEELLSNLDYVFFNMKEVRDDKTRKLIPSLYKILSKFYLLKEKYFFESSVHTLNTKFYNELLYLMGLSEEKENGKKVIKLDPNIKSSIGEQVYTMFTEKENKSEKEAYELTFELIIIWLDRILFIKLFEGQLITFNEDTPDYHILDVEKIKTFDDLDNLFFNILGKNIESRKDNEFDKIPYLNSALFERQELELDGINISQLQNEHILLKSDSILKNKQFNSLPILEYIIRFLNGYDFGSVQREDSVKEQGKDIIDSSVLGLIFEKINGYKDGSVYTPSQITEFIAKETVEKIVLKKANEQLNRKIKNIQELKFYIKDCHSLELYKKLNEIINSITYCDPSVGSGHFLVSLLNRIIYIKYDLGILMYYNSDEPIRDFNIYIEDDTLMIENAQGEPFKYDKSNILSQKMQETLFNEKRIIIEKCLFGADLNPKAVYICQLRLWIELLKNAYYKNHIMQTLPNIDVNINSGNSLVSRINFEVGKDVALGKQLDISSRKNIIKEYKNSVKKYISEDNKEEKNKIKKMIKNFDDFYIHPKIQTSLFEQNEKEMEEAELYKGSLEWALQFPEILDENGVFKGFDCVIGNPPYIGESGNKDIFRCVAKTEFGKKYYTGKMDFWYFFISRGIELLKPNGILSYIAPNNWMTTFGGKQMRNHILNTCKILDYYSFKDFMVFDVASQQTMILTLEKNNNNSKYEFNFNELDAYDKEKSKEDTINEFLNKKIGINYLCEIEKDECLDNTFHFLNKNIKLYIDKIKNIGTFYLNKDNEITNGIHPHHAKITKKMLENIPNPELKVNDGIFIVSDSEIKEMNLNDTEKLLIKPYFDTSNIKRYNFNNKTDQRIIYTNSQFKNEKIMENYPNIKKHLDKYRNYITSDNKPYGLHRARNPEFFEKEKIVSLRKCEKPSFTYINEPAYVTAEFYVIKSNRINLKYLLGILNSELISFWLRYVGKMQGTHYQIDAEPLANIPICVNKNYENELIKAVEQNLEEQNNEETINKIVYKIYNFAEEEQNEIKELLKL